MCYCPEHGKVCYLTYYQAQEAVRKHRGRRKRSNRRMHAYRCPHCNQFHIGRPGRSIRHRHI